MAIRFIDLSVPLHNFASEFNSPQITYWDHRDFGHRTATKWGLDPADFPEPHVGSAAEELTLASHAGTHIDAPWHFGPTTAGLPAKTVDEVPLEWCYGNGVLLDFSTKTTADPIDVGDLQEALAKIDHQLQPLDIVLLRTGAEDYWDKPEYNEMGTGLTAAAVEWLVQQGVRMITTDAFSLDIPLKYMAEKLRNGDKDGFFPAHRIGREVEYVHAEKVVNLKALPTTGFTVALFPIKIRRASGAWCRAVAILEDDA
ncbi:cyclase family protein [Leekyejoonella antrihumi]|uniref:Cyclase family protein n=1 Tax=Leekyejoonella antrihumi TaxID=1660198 RepID=A0A563DST1_9MICO|nr:cyclase family protein [Leekyejoonella antrihumi]TWP33236.1 cyclase family protein [Leekyejoonella antrihumi]